MTGKRFLRKVASRLCGYPAGQIFHRNRSISLHFRNKLVFAFNAEIQDGRQNWRENDFCEKLLVDFADTQRVKNFIKITLSHTVFKIFTLFHFPQKSKMAAKSGKN